MLAAGLAALALLGVGVPAAAREDVPPPAQPAPIALDELPREAHTVLHRIRQGGPFPYDKDGTVFFNRERLLPAHKRGYYREYTVPTPGRRDRGTRRIVCGGWQPTVPDVCYYTADHYASFRRIVP
ncbi:Guanyl-specific ribonuclease Sa3 [Tepidimonas thermarum]|uniref:Guanyl-specific ribonuclease Sa3 n=1 Tax=Tepidimonas thermarum TaxID=335431 RepID=A0A554WWY0_9BURK|nr:ribonuclease domain-containing protein [Tepidimonas thermarum]TSE28071.1 Guanyl-specific ribonuclease Sa3 [Tepidimonas thermarum]